MQYIEKVHFYVEKYDRFRGELLLDFVREDEFIFFRNRGDYAPSMHLTGGIYEPTMILVYGCFPKRTIWHGAMMTMDMNSLLKMSKAGNFYLDNRLPERPSTVFLEIQNGAEFADLIDDLSECFVARNVPPEYEIYLRPSWYGAPCALENLRDPLELSVWNVGQGNVNCISDGENLTIFDFGASIYYSKKKAKEIFDAHEDYIMNHAKISLIISHWDIDHYNFLCVAPDNFLQKICCIFYPSHGTGVTFMQVAARIEKNCRYRNTIGPAPRTSHKCGIQKVFEGGRYILFTGEQSKNKNKSGLLLSVFSKTATAFLTADHSNYQVWDQMYTLVNAKTDNLHVVVPHHGGDCDNTPVQRGSTPGIAVISVGSNNYGHPKRKTISSYRNVGYMVKQTDRCGHDIVIEM